MCPDYVNSGGIICSDKELKLKTKLFIIALLASFIVALTALAAEHQGEGKDKDQKKAASDLKLETEMQKVSYIIGTQLAQNFKQQEIDIQPEALAQGIKDVLQDKELAMSQEEIQQTMMQFQMKMMQKQQAKAQEQEQEGQDFLDENKKKEGVKVTDTGLQYKVLKEGDGEKPKPTDTVKVHYVGKLLDGTTFDSSYERGEPATFQLNQVISGWTEGLQLMKEGAKYKFWIPPQLGYGARGSRNIPPQATLVFEVELIEVNPEQADQGQGQQIPQNQ